MNFGDIKQDTCRLVVMFFRRGPDGGEQFQWGIVGALPILTLIGYITRVEFNMVNQLAEQRNDCPEMALVIAWDGQVFDWWIHREIPVDPMVGMLETIKIALVGSATAQRALAQRTQLLGPDGKPFPFRS